MSSQSPAVATWRSMSPVDTSRSTWPLASHSSHCIQGWQRRAEALAVNAVCIQGNRSRDKLNLDSMHQADNGLVFRDGQLLQTFQQ